MIQVEGDRTRRSNLDRRSTWAVEAALIGGDCNDEEADDRRSNRGRDHRRRRTSHLPVVEGNSSGPHAVGAVGSTSAVEGAVVAVDGEGDADMSEMGLVLDPVACVTSSLPVYRGETSSRETKKFSAVMAMTRATSRFDLTLAIGRLRHFRSCGGRRDRRCVCLWLEVCMQSTIQVCTQWDRARNNSIFDQ